MSLQKSDNSNVYPIMNKKHLKSVDQKTKNLLFGYLRNMHHRQSMPTMINYLCLLYFVINEKFDIQSIKHAVDCFDLEE